MRTVVVTAMERDQGSGFSDYLCNMVRGRRGGYWLSEERAVIQQNTPGSVGITSCQVREYMVRVAQK